MKSTHYSKYGLTTGIFLVVLYFICLAWGALMTTPDMTELHQQLLAMTFPGFSWLTASSIFWGAFLSFVYGFLAAELFLFIHMLCCPSKR